VKLVKDRSGTAIIYVTLFLMVLGLLFLALGIDVGWLVFVRSQGQSAVDAAALRGAAALPNYNHTNDATKVNTMVRGINADNRVMNQGAGLEDTHIEFCTGTPEGPDCPSLTTPATGVRVTNTYTAPLFFAGILNEGNNSANITVSATAWLGGPAECGADCLPMGLCQSAISSCGASTKWDGVGNSAWWRPAAGATGDTCAAMVNNPSLVPNIKVEDLVGQLTPCFDAVKTRFITQNFCDAAKCKAQDSACTVVLPVLDCSGSGSVKGFVSLCIADVQSAFVQGTMTCDIAAPGTSAGGPFLGTYGERPTLVK
jgi:Flp pilus assembly protein TadG